MNKKSLKLRRGEIALYVILILVALTGLALIICGIVGSHLDLTMDDNSIAYTESVLIGATGLGYRWWGTIILVVAAVIAAIALSSFAKKEDRDEERNARRRERMQILTETQGDTLTAGAIEAKATPVAEATPAEPAKE